MPGKDIPAIVMGTFVSQDGVTHLVPSHTDERNSKVARPMKGHVFHGYCCYREQQKAPNGQIVIVHTIIH